jgi:hypothetical protein
LGKQLDRSKLKDSQLEIREVETKIQAVEKKGEQGCQLPGSDAREQ